MSVKYKLSQATEGLIERLYARAGLWNRFVYAEKPEEIIQQISMAGEPAAIPELLSILLTGDKQSVEACAEAIQHLTQRVRPAEFSSFEEFVRQNCTHWQPRRASWYQMQLGDIRHLADLRGAAASVLGMASFHKNGRIREGAVRELARIRTADELPFLLVRANDWVEAVRLPARNFIMDRIRPDYVDHFSVWLPLALRLEKASRGDHTMIIRGIRELFAKRDVRAVLQSGLEAEDKLARRFCFDVALNLDTECQRHAILTAFQASDIQVRKAAASRLAAILPAGEHDELVVLARKDSCASVRRAALKIYSEKFPERAEEQFLSALLDSNIAVREEAREFFRKKNAFAVRRYYIERLQAKDIRTLCPAIAGVGEAGVASDADALEAFLASPSPRIRATTLRALGKLDADGHIDRFLSALQDSSGKVAREGTLVLGRRANLVGAARLWQVYLRASHAHGKRFAVYLLARVNKWDSITYLLQSLSDSDERVAELGRRYVARWFARYNRSFIAPSAAQLAKLKSVLDERNLLVSAEAQRQMESILKSFAGAGR